MNPRYTVDDIDPATILDVGHAQQLVDGSIAVALVTRNVPLDEVDTLGRVLALGIGKHLGFDEADSEILAERVVAHLKIGIEETLRGDPDDFSMDLLSDS